MRHDKFLFRGKVWVDAHEYAVARIDAEPAESPSFWIKKTVIHYIYGKVGDSWFPLQSRSETKVRIGGTATLAVDYTHYEIQESDHNAVLSKGQNP